MGNAKKTLKRSRSFRYALKDGAGIPIPLEGIGMKAPAAWSREGPGAG